LPRLVKSLWENGRKGSTAAPYQKKLTRKISEGPEGTQIDWGGEKYICPEFRGKIKVWINTSCTGRGKKRANQCREEKKEASFRGKSEKKMYPTLLVRRERNTRGEEGGKKEEIVCK